MKPSTRQVSCFFFALILAFTLLPIDASLAQRGRGGGGRGGGGGASPRMSGGGGMQNRGSFNRSGGSHNRSAGQANRQSPSQSRQGDRQSIQQNRQSTWQDGQAQRSQNQQNRQSTWQDGQAQRSQNQQNRQNQMSNNQSNRQNQINNNQNNRQNFIDDNNNWYGGGWYGGGYYAPAGWGVVGLTTGLALGSALAAPPPYYDTVYVGSTSYIYSDGVYLQPSGSQYVVVAPPPGATVAYLPDGCVSIAANGASYFNCSGVYYQPYFQNGATVYQVVQF
ncbi:MAG: hypothetical protein GC158_09235 [Cyanobacteria bacterium RI_101]|nr:hypothetical protein [Cyanobacteria bacterium RI_101]